MNPSDPVMDLSLIKKLPPAKGRRMSRPRSPSPSPSVSKEAWQKWYLNEGKVSMPTPVTGQRAMELWMDELKAMIPKTWTGLKPTLSARTDPASGALTAASFALTEPTSSLTGRGDLRINGIPTKGNWELKLTRDYVDATVFGDTNKTYLAGMNIADLTYEVSERPKSEFDFDAAEEVYEDDPVALAIISRLESMEKEVALLRDEKASLIIKEKEARAAHVAAQQKMYDLRNAKRHITQWEADDPVANRRKSRKALRKGR